mmetsp:Transcript_25201/g.39849  ORF Transcript_25201/g.39849 Transcript_25201/m.39849 type:complete len:242 (-) Transcript_25201:9-734(-)
MESSVMLGFVRSSRWMYRHVGTLSLLPPSAREVTWSLSRRAIIRNFMPSSSTWRSWNPGRNIRSTHLYVGWFFTTNCTAAFRCGGSFANIELSSIIRWSSGLKGRALRSSVSSRGFWQNARASREQTPSPKSLCPTHAPWSVPCPLNAAANASPAASSRLQWLRSKCSSPTLAFSASASATPPAASALWATSRRSSVRFKRNSSANDSQHFSVRPLWLTVRDVTAVLCSKCLQRMTTASSE